MTSFDLPRILADTFVRRVEYRDELDSTSDLALRWAAEANSERPLLVLADRQLRGRGRGENRWWTGQGALTFSLVVDISLLRQQSPAWPRVSLATALAVCEAILERWPHHDVRIKWPNDVFLQGRSLRHSGGDRGFPS